MSDYVNAPRFPADIRDDERTKERAAAIRYLRNSIPAVEDEPWAEYMLRIVSDIERGMHRE